MPSPSIRFARSPRVSTAKLPALQFGFLVGTFDHSTLVPEGKTRPDNNHIYLWIRVPSGPLAGQFECAFNIHSADGAGADAEVLFTERRQDLANMPFPAPDSQPKACRSPTSAWPMPISRRWSRESCNRSSRN